LTTELPDLSILPSYGWAAQAAFYVGLWADAERKAHPNEFTRLVTSECFEPLRSTNRPG